MTRSRLIGTALTTSSENDYKLIKNQIAELTPVLRLPRRC